MKGGPNWSKLGSFVDKHHILHVTDLIFGSNGKKLCHGDFSCLPMLLKSVSNVLSPKL